MIYFSVCAIPLVFITRPAVISSFIIHHNNPFLVICFWPAGPLFTFAKSFLLFGWQRLGIFSIHHYLLMQRYIQDPVKDLRWSVLLKQSTAKSGYFHETRSILDVWQGSEYASVMISRAWVSLFFRATCFWLAGLWLLFYRKFSFLPANMGKKFGMWFIFGHFFGYYCLEQDPLKMGWFKERFWKYNLIEVF